MNPTGLAGPRSVRLWLDMPSTNRPGEPLAGGLDNVQWKTYGSVFWLELTEPTLPHLLAQIDRIVARGVGYRHLVGATRYGTLLLLDEPEEPLPLSEMIVITNSRHVRIWWGLSPPNEAMDLLFRAHRDADDGNETPAPPGQSYRPRNNRDDPQEEEQELEPEEPEEEEEEEPEEPEEEEEPEEPEEEEEEEPDEEEPEDDDGDGDDGDGEDGGGDDGSGDDDDDDDDDGAQPESSQAAALRPPARKPSRGKHA